MTIEWWHIPAILTVIGLAAMLWPSRAAYSPFTAVIKLVFGLLAAIGILAVWLVGALLR